MKKWLEGVLICPNCSPLEIPLELKVGKLHEEDVIEGELTCPQCSRAYTIHNGVAVLLPDDSHSALSSSAGYNSRSMLSAYLWSHFCDLFQDPQATEAYRTWSSYFRESSGWALDIGCSVGRLSFELSKTHPRVIGIDTSVSFVQKARELLHSRKLRFDLIIEGFITEEISCEFDPEWRYDRIDFVVADALALPFPQNYFSTVASINVLEKVSKPIQHLADVNRVLKDNDSMFVFSDPFSWDETLLDPSLWLGGVKEGAFQPRGMDSVVELLQGKNGVIDPPLTIKGFGKVDWKIRKTENLWEHITSLYAVGTRD